MLLRDYIRRAANSYGDKTAFIDGDIRRDWRTVDERSARFGAALQKLGVRKGDVVCILAHEHLEVIEHFLACAKIGAIRVGINWRYSPREQEHIIRDSSAKAVLVQANCHEQIAQFLPDLEKEGRVLIGFGENHGLRYDYESLIAQNLNHPDHVDLAPDDLLAYSYTTGTTGLPKGALWTQSLVVESNVHSIFNLGLRHEDIWLMPAPTPGAPILFNTFGVINGMTTTMINGDFAADKYWDIVERDRVTASGGVPTMIRRLLEEYDSGNYDASTLGNLFYGSSPMPPTLTKRLFNTLDCDLIQPYGSTETGGWVTYLRQDEHRRAVQENDFRLLESCGRPSQHADVTILDEEGKEVPDGEVGEVCVASGTNTVGYLNLPQETEELYFGKWLRTGDLGNRDKNGYYFLVDRRKFMIISGGYNVYPVVVENVLAEHTAVREVSVIGAPHPEWGEVVTAVISLKNGQNVSSEELIEFVRPKIGKWEVPKYIEFIDDLPRGVTGKIDKISLRQRFKDSPDLLPWSV